MEYSLLVAGVASMGAAAVSIFGHKTSDLMAAVAAVLPGAHEDDNAALVSGKIVETTDPGGGPIQLDIAGIVANTDTERLGNNILGVANNTGANALTNLVVEANP